MGDLNQASPTLQPRGKTSVNPMHVWKNVSERRTPDLPCIELCLHVVVFEQACYENPAGGGLLATLCAAGARGSNGTLLGSSVYFSLKAPCSRLITIGTSKYSATGWRGTMAGTEFLPNAIFCRFLTTTCGTEHCLEQQRMFFTFRGCSGKSVNIYAWRIQHLLPSSCLAYIHRPWRKHIDMMLISLLTLAWYMFCPALNSCCTHARTIKLALTRVQSAFVHCFFTRVACTLHVQLRSDNLDEVIAAAEVAFVSVS